MIAVETSNPARARISRQLIRDVIAGTLKYLKFGKDARVSVALVGESEMKEINGKYRGKNEVTDVLSFGERDSLLEYPGPQGNFLGEIIICYPQAVAQAREKDRLVGEEARVLLVHGLLHLLGFDHKKKGEAEKMEALEKEILSKTGRRQ